LKWIIVVSNIQIPNLAVSHVQENWLGYVQSEILYTKISAIETLQTQISSIALFYQVL
jgi:hypothetical protein